ncbi:hypothetical protein D2Q93_00305 [Alicyclobacillaceae bacterium I2511]|nr:hypothetical protein D2Q93_00305 [Alicyclobacillaceae bacterium I2511]
MSPDNERVWTNEILREETPKHHSGPWVRIVLAHGEALELPADIWIQSGFKVGTEITLAAEERLRIAQQRAVGMEIGLRYLDRKLCTVKEMRMYLQRKKVDEQTADQVIQTLQAKGWLDDMAYASEFVATLSCRFSRREMAWKLSRRGISREVVDEVMTAGDDEAECEVALQMARKFWKKGGTVDQELHRRKLILYLQRRGFTSTSIRFALDRILCVTDEYLNTFLDND